MGSYARSVHEKMLANLTSLIWGSQDASPTTPSTGPTKACDPAWEEVAETQSEISIRATTPADEEESDWVLVDRAASPSSQPTSGETEDSTMREDVGGEGGDQAVEAAHAARSGVSQRAPSLLRAIDVLRPAQKAQRRREERRLKRKALEHVNKAREVASAGKKPAKRCDMMVPGKFSRVVNNRKC